MCGITGILSFNENGGKFLHKAKSAVLSLNSRGPDGNGIYSHNNVVLGHTRLAVIDTSEAASQPFSDFTGRFTIVFNGEFYDYKRYRIILQQKGIPLKSNSDTEVLLYLYIQEGISCLEKINGCFAFAIYDKAEESLILARDRTGINPLLYYIDNDKFIFGSEMKALLSYNVPKEIDYISLYNYFQLNYIPSPYSVFKNIKKLTPGAYLTVKAGNLTEKKYYSIPQAWNAQATIQYPDAKKRLESLMEQAVNRWMVADVPIGVFLSGGIDSSIITALATRFSKHINTFTIGYKDEPFFDETYYANLVAKQYSTQHTCFSLSNDDLLENMFRVLDYIDEPFADSSALAVYILSMHTREKVKVALSGDGADEMFAGYHKHAAHLMARNPGILGPLIKAGGALLKNLPQSRNNIFSNKIRQLNRFAQGLKLSDEERYWRWCGLADETEVNRLLKFNIENNEYIKRKKVLLQYIGKTNQMDRLDINDILYSDMNLVLQSDMLAKTNLMSMANGLEVRTPFLDHTVIDFIFSLPCYYKINTHIKKKILQETFSPFLPPELFNRQKHGFEVPMLKWMRRELKPLILNELLEEEFIREQKIFHYESIRSMINRLFSKNPKDIHARIWALVVFQHWWKKYYQ